MRKFFIIFLMLLGVSVFADDFENLRTFPKGPFIPYSDVWSVKNAVKLDLPGSVYGESQNRSIKLSEMSRNSAKVINKIQEHFSVYKDANNENWLRFCVDTENEKGTTSGSDYLRSEIHCGYLKDYSSLLKTSKGYTFEFEGTFRINTSQLTGNKTMIPGTKKASADKVCFLQVHEERELGISRGKHNPPTIQLCVDNKNRISLSYCPDRVNLTDDKNPDDIKPVTRGRTLLKDYKSLDPIHVRLVYTGTEMYVYINDELKFDANELTKELYGQDTKYRLHENNNSYLKFGCYANTYKGFQCVYVKDIVAKHYKTDGSGEETVYFSLK